MVGTDNVELNQNRPTTIYLSVRHFIRGISLIYIFALTLWHWKKGANLGLSAISPIDVVDGARSRHRVP
jgi:hypothetical protein